MQTSPRLTVFVTLFVILAASLVHAGTTVDVYPGTDIASVVAANAAGTTFIIHPGTYRVNTITAKTGDSFIGATSCAPPKTACPAILSGAVVLTSFKQQGTYYMVTGQNQNNAVTVPDTKCEPMNPGYPIAYPGCIYPEDLFFDNKPLVHVTSLANVGPGTWFFDYPSATIYFYDNPTGHTVEASVTASAFAWGPANNVKIQYLTVEKYATPVLRAAIGGFPFGFGSTSSGANWTVANNEIAYNHADAVGPSFGWQVLNNYIHHNGNRGVGGGIGGGNSDGSGTLPSGVLIQGNEIAYNNFAHVSPHFGAGGVKITMTYNMVYRGNYVHNNEGSGFHSDLGNHGALYDNNISADNTEQGIFHEISYAATVRNNKLLRNGYIHPNWTFWMYGANLLSSTSSGVVAYCNTVEISAQGGNGIDIIVQDRPGEILSSGNNFHHNTVTFDGNSGMTGAARGSATDPMETNFYAQNYFDSNTYHMPDVTRKAFRWNDKFQSFAQFQADGQDVHGSADENYKGSIPSVAITSPADQSSVKGTVTVAANATDPGSITKVEWYVDWTLSKTDTASPFNFSWNTTPVAAGSHVVTAMAYNPSGSRACYAVTLNVTH